MKMINAQPEYFAENAGKLVRFDGYSPVILMTGLNNTDFPIPGYNPQPMTEHGVPNHYFFIPMLDVGLENSKLTLTISTKGDANFSHSLSSSVNFSKSLSNEEAWLAGTRGSAYAMEGLWRGRLTAYNNQKTLNGDFDPDPFTNASSNLFYGFAPNAYYLNKDDGVEPNFKDFREMLSAFAKDEAAAYKKYTAGFQYSPHYTDRKAFHWDSFDHTTDFGMTVGQSKTNPHDPRHRINPALLVGLNTSSTDVPVMQNEYFKAGIMYAMAEDGHVSRMRTPIGDVSTYITQDGRNDYVVTTVLENDQHIHSNAQVNERMLMSMHAATVFTLQAYGIAKSHNGEVALGDLDPNFFANHKNGVEFWNEVKSNISSTYVPENLDSITHVSRYASEAVTHPATLLENVIINEQMKEHYLVIEPTFSTALIYTSNQVLNVENIRFSTFDLESMIADYLYFGEMTGDELTKVLEEKIEAYKLFNDELNQLFDHSNEAINYIRNGHPLFDRASGEYKTLTDENILDFFEISLQYGIQKDSTESLYASMQPNLHEINGQAVESYLNKLPILQVGDLSLFDRLQREKREMHVNNLLESNDVSLTQYAIERERDLRKQIGG